MAIVGMNLQKQQALNTARSIQCFVCLEEKGIDLAYVTTAKRGLDRFATELRQVPCNQTGHQPTEGQKI